MSGEEGEKGKDSAYRTENLECHAQLKTLGTTPNPLPPKESRSQAEGRLRMLSSSRALLLCG